MIEAAFKAFARALRQAVAIDPTETGVPSTKGTLTRMSAARCEPSPCEIAVVDYGMGNRRSVEKALRARRRARLVSGDPERLRAAAGLVLPGVGAFPRAMERPRASSASTSCCASASRRARRCSGICLGMQLAFERSTEQGGAAGPRHRPARCARWRRAR